jgi:dsRNA-specific ribonuclease
MVMSQKVITVEEDLATFRAKSISNEAEMKNSKRAVAELTSDRKKVLIELEKVKAELKARDGDVKVAVEAKDKAVANLQHLVGQIKGAKAVAVLEFRSSEAFEYLNTHYFLSGFEALRKQVAECFPDLDFSVF